MRASLTLVTLLALPLAGCGDEPRYGPDVRVTVNGETTTLDLGGMQAAAERPLGAADVERFLAALPDWHRVGSRADEWQQVARNHGYGTGEWLVIQGRILQAMARLQMPDVGLPAGQRGDVDVVRPFVDRINAALKAR
jgi:hypothetical protein